MATPEHADAFIRDFDARKSQISSELNVFFVPWKDEFFGTDRDLTLQLKFSGEIVVSGKDESECKKKIENVRRELEAIYESSLPYEEPKLVEVEFREDAEANIGKIVFPGIMEIVRKEISKEYDIKDVSFLFTSDTPKRDLQVSFERTSYVRGKENVPLRVAIVAPTKEMCEKVWQSLGEKLEMKPRLFKGK